MMNTDSDACVKYTNLLKICGLFRTELNDLLELYAYVFKSSHLLLSY
jgi:DNA-binding Xre family transcriptional regulator